MLCAASGRALRRSTEATVPPMTRPTQLVLLIAGAFGALMLGTSFGSAQQVPPAAQPPPALAPAAPAAPASAQPAPAAAKPTPAITLSPADLAFIDRVTWGANESTAAEFVSLGRDRWLDRQLHPGPKDRLPAAALAIINALPIATHPVTEIAWPLAAQQRNTSQIPDPEQKKTQQQAFQQALNELGRQAATRSLLRDIYSADQLREKMTWFWFNCSIHTISAVAARPAPASS